MDWSAVKHHLNEIRHQLFQLEGTNLLLLASLVFLLGLMLNRRRWRVWSAEAFEASFANLLLILMNGALAPLFVILVDVTESGYAQFSLPHLDPAIWNLLPTWLTILLVLLAIDLADYWNHRLMHGSRWLWPIHAIHHSDPQLTPLSTGRVHLLEPFVMQVSYIILLTWLKLPYEVLGGLSALRLLHNMYTHLNVDWDHGPLKYLIASPRYHRWHHADTPAAYGKNLANLFPFLDLLFGTYYVPGRCDVTVGAKGVPTVPLDMVAWPFIAWHKMLVRRIRRLWTDRNNHHAICRKSTIVD